MPTLSPLEACIKQAEQLLNDLHAMSGAVPVPVWKPRFKVGDRVKHLFTGSPGTVYEYCSGIREIFVHLDIGNDVNGPNDSFQLIPWTLPHHIPGFRALAEGEEWHRAEGWKEEWLSGGWRPLLLGEVIDPDGKDQILRVCASDWAPADTCAGHSATIGHANLRTTRPLPPLEKRVELTAEDCPPGSYLRPADSPEAWSSVICCNGAEVVALFPFKGLQPSALTFSELMDDGWKILRPGKASWEPCSKRAQGE